MKVSILGQGYVGLNVSVAAAKAGHAVTGIDINESLIANLKIGIHQVPGIERNIILDLISSNKYIPTTDPSYISNSDIVIITVPTPLNFERNPDLSLLETASRIIGKYARDNLLIINESTSYPGTLRNFIAPLVCDSNKNKLFFAASPERVDPGNSEWNLENTPRVISGLNSEATLRAKKFYSSFCENIYEVSNPEVAEASKLLENTFRQVNIALVNEFSEIAYKLNFSANEAISAASTKPFGFMPFFPSIGVGGHCIPIDPSYLSYAANLVGVSANFINLANETNLLASKKIATRITEYMGGSLIDLKIQVAGIAYKTNVSDMRESPSLLLIRELRSLGANVSWSDDLVREYKNEKSLPLTSDIDLGLIVTPHDGMKFDVWLRSGVKVLDLSSNSKNFGWPKFL
jgi:UDP-N-acetyl-D-glucosamine dehydrogenase